MKTYLLAFLMLVSGLHAQIVTNPSTGGGVTTGSVLPATCTPSSPPNLFFLTTGSIGLYQCLSTNTWTQVPLTSTGGTLLTPPSQSFSSVTSPQTFTHNLGSTSHITTCQDASGNQVLTGITIGQNSDTITFSDTISFTCTAIGGVAVYTVATLPVGPPTNTPAIVTDALTAGNCTTGGGTNKAFCMYNGASWVSIATAGTQTVASGTAALGTSAIASAACATVVTATATGAASTDAIIWNPNGSIKAVTGFVPATTGGLTIAAYPTANAVNFDVCNWSTGTITPGAVTINWRVVR